LSATPPQTPDERACDTCGARLPESSLLSFAGRRWCAACKASPAFQEAVSGGRAPASAAAGAGLGRGGKIALAVVAGLLLLCLGSAVGVGLLVRRRVESIRADLGAYDRDSCRAELERLGRALRRRRIASGAFPTRAPGESVLDVIARLDREGLLEQGRYWEEGEPLYQCAGVPYDESDRAVASYEGLGGGAALAHTGPERPLLWDADESRHDASGAGRNVLFENGAVRWIPRGAAVTVLGDDHAPARPGVVDENLEEKLLEARREREEFLREEAADEELARTEYAMPLVPTLSAEASPLPTEEESETAPRPDGGR